MSEHLEQDFAKLFKFLRIRNEEIALFADDDEISEEQRDIISRFVAKDLPENEEERAKFFSSFRDDPRLIRELSKKIKESEEQSGS